MRSVPLARAYFHPLRRLVVDLSRMKLKFLLQKNAWFIEHERAWYCIRDEAQMCLAASVMPLSVVDLSAVRTEPHLAGVASLVIEVSRSERGFLRKEFVEEETGVVRVTLSEPDGAPITEQRMTLDARALFSIEWLTHPFDDGWLVSDATLALDYIQRLELGAFLPASPSSTGKMLTIRNETEGTASEVWLERDTNNIVPLIDGSSRGRVVLRLECEPEPVDEARDPRSLGFVLVDQSLQAA